MIVDPLKGTFGAKWGNRPSQGEKYEGVEDGSKTNHQKGDLRWMDPQVNYGKMKNGLPFCESSKTGFQSFSILQSLFIGNTKEHVILPQPFKFHPL